MKSKEQNKIKNLTTHKGITLIALVVTIIILLILAAISITAVFGENGLIKTATRAREQKSIADEKEQITLAYNAAFAEKLGSKIEKEDLQKHLDILLGEGKTKVGKEQKFIVLYTETKRMYFLDDNGNISNNSEKTTGEPKIGDYVLYDPITGAKKTKYESFSNQTFSLTGNNASYDTSKYGWRVLGRDETGKVLITSEEIVTPQNKDEYVIYGENEYIYGKDELDEICKLYGQGFGAVNARSITIDDINKITGYSEINKELYRLGKIDEYGNNINLYWDGTLNPYYLSSNGTIGSFDLHDKYRYFDFNLNMWKESKKSNTASINNRELITTIKNNAYSYYPNTLNENEYGETKGIDTNSAEYSLLFKGDSGRYLNYWLGEKTVSPIRNNYMWYCYKRISKGKVGGSRLIADSNPMTSGVVFSPLGVRPVITLDASFVGSSETGWEIKEPVTNQEETEVDNPTKEEFFTFDSTTGMITGCVEDTTENFTGIGWHSGTGANERISSETTIIIPKEIKGVAVKRYFKWSI